MKKVLTSVCLLGAVSLLAACESTRGSEAGDPAPYAAERTAGAAPAGSTSTTKIRSADRVFKQHQLK